LAHADSQNPELLKHYEGLVYKTALLTAPLVEEDFDDIVQLLRIKVWRVLIAWDPARAPKLVARVGLDEARDRSVFAWLKNYQRDLIKKKRRGEVSLDAGIGGNDGMDDNVGTFHGTRPEITVGTAFGAEDVGYVHVEAGMPLIPSTLTDPELRVVCLLYSEYRQSEVAVFLELPKREVERLVRSIRTKMADWAPSSTSPAATEDPCPETSIAA
jgi:hypothetical protein